MDLRDNYSLILDAQGIDNPPGAFRLTPPTLATAQLRDWEGNLITFYYFYEISIREKLTGSLNLRCKAELSRPSLAPFTWDPQQDSHTVHAVISVTVSIARRRGANLPKMMEHFVLDNA